ncbi:NAD(+) kinase [Marinagarivorans cellulosilyticus]|uniref:NAD kinase n=1 Tax=Marinagarivorans cellulosilyticus TaxID=2721545 RepID=A0AAN1WJ14_9GAMM|nr:NAD(+) kinase [Marinagarivorans cellulosilyticus]BCD98442.1 NAD+ kinase [Marinagarivorans cellulosilyticus]
MSEFSCVGLIGRLGSEAVAYSLKRLVAFLNERNVKILLDNETGAVVPDASVTRVRREQLPSLCDLVIVVGGDGSLLGSARLMAGTGVPLLGINRGRLGFLTDISPEDIELKVGEVLDGSYEREQRFLLQATVSRNQQVIGQSLALNDVVLHPGQFIRMIDFELYIDETFVYRQSSDGLIISTPTGSTAYALSGGGPIMHPSLDALVLVPMNPHTLSSRPIVVSGGSDIRLVVGEQRDVHPHVTCDGQVHIVTQTGDEVAITKSPDCIDLIHPKGHRFYQVCRSKLGWAARQASEGSAFNDFEE